MYFSPECSRAIRMGSLKRIKRKYVSRFPGCPFGELDDLPGKFATVPSAFMFRWFQGSE
jgi:hypothetical protein